MEETRFGIDETLAKAPDEVQHRQSKYGEEEGGVWKEGFGKSTKIQTGFWGGGREVPDV